MQNIGLVFSGGGGKGSYQIGVWKAICELGLDKRIGDIAGTSIGALNAFGLVTSKNNLIEDLWLNNKTEDFLSKPFMDLLADCEGLTSEELYDELGKVVKKYGYAPRELFLKMIEEEFNIECLKTFNKCIFAGVYNETDLKMEYMDMAGDKDKELVCKILCASTALPNVYSPVEINGKSYIDGGVDDNIPVKPLYNKGIKEIIVVHFHHSEIEKLKCFDDAKIISIIPSYPEENLKNGTLDFSPERAKIRIEAGYKDGLKILSREYS